jgi:hypothetical protein
MEMGGVGFQDVPGTSHVSAGLLGSRRPRCVTACPLVSHNAKHFEKIPGLNLITGENPS